MYRKIIIPILALLMFILSLTACKSAKSISARAKDQLELGDKYLQEAKYEEAILVFEKVIEIEPKHIPARVSLAKAYTGAGKPEKAEEVLKDALNIDSKSTEVYITLADVYVSQGSGEEAINLLEKAYADTGDADIKSKLDELKETSSQNVKIDYERVTSGVDISTINFHKDEIGTNINIDKEKVDSQFVRDNARYIYLSWSNVPADAKALKDTIDYFTSQVKDFAPFPIMGFYAPTNEGKFFYQLFFLDGDKKVIGYYQNENPIEIDYGDFITLIPGIRYRPATPEEVRRFGHSSILCKIDMDKLPQSIQENTHGVFTVWRTEPIEKKSYDYVIKNMERRPAFIPGEITMQVDEEGSYYMCVAFYDKNHNIIGTYQTSEPIFIEVN